MRPFALRRSPLLYDPTAQFENPLERSFKPDDTSLMNQAKADPIVVLLTGESPKRNEGWPDTELALALYVVCSGRNNKRGTAPQCLSLITLRLEEGRVRTGIGLPELCVAFVRLSAELVSESLL